MIFRFDHNGQCYGCWAFTACFDTYVAKKVKSEGKSARDKIIHKKYSTVKKIERIEDPRVVCSEYMPSRVKRILVTMLQAFLWIPLKQQEYLLHFQKPTTGHPIVSKSEPKFSFDK